MVNPSGERLEKCEREAWYSWHHSLVRVRPFVLVSALACLVLALLPPDPTSV